MTWANYTFYLNSLQINQMLSQSYDNPDVDSVYFAVGVGAQIYPCPACYPDVGPPGGYLGPVSNYYIPANGATVIDLYGDLGDGNRVPRQLAWVTGPIPIQDTDTVNVYFQVTNLNTNANSSEGEYIAEGLKIGGDIDAALAAAISFDPTVSLIVAAFGGIVETVGEILGFIEAHESPVCAGTVFREVYTFTGAQLEEQVATPTADEAQEENIFTATWTETNLQGIVPSKGCNVANSNLTWSVLRDRSNQLQFGGGSAPPAQAQAQLRPVTASSSPQDWVSSSNIWGDGSTTEDSRVLCQLTATGKGPAGLGDPTTAAESYVGGIIHTLQNASAAIDLFGGSVATVRPGSLLVPKVPVAPPVLRSTTLRAMPVTARYGVALTEASSPGEKPFIDISASDLAEIPMLASNFTQDLYPPPEGAAQRPVQLTGRPPVVKAAPADLSNPVPLSYAATIVPSANDSLQLYGSYGQDGALREYRLRYMHTNQAGEPTTDVMLRPVEEPPQ